MSAQNIVSSAAATDISCYDSVHLVSLLRDGELTGFDQARLERHLKDCVRCQIARKQFETLYRALDAILGRATQNSTSDFS